MILGKVIPYFAIGLLDVALAVLMGQCLFHVPMRGSLRRCSSPWRRSFWSGVLSMGITISIVAKSQLLASQLAMTLTFLPSFLLSGFMFTIVNMPRPIQGSPTWCRPATSWPCCGGFISRAWGWSFWPATRVLLCGLRRGYGAVWPECECSKKKN